MLVKTSPCAVPSERRAVASPGDVRSKVRVPDVVIWPDGDTVTGLQKDKDNTLIDFRIKTFECFINALYCPQLHGQWDLETTFYKTRYFVLYIYIYISPTFSGGTPFFRKT